MNLQDMLQTFIVLIDRGARPEDEVRIRVNDDQWFSITNIALGMEGGGLFIMCEPDDRPPNNYYFDDRGRFCRRWGSFEDDPEIARLMVDGQDKIVVGHEFKTDGFVQPDHNGWWRIQGVEPQALEVESIDRP